MYYITYHNETVVYNSNRKPLVSVPTEQEAIEILKLREERDGNDDNI